MNIQSGLCRYMRCCRLMGYVCNEDVIFSIIVVRVHQGLDFPFSSGCFTLALKGCYHNKQCTALFFFILASTRLANFSNSAIHQFQKERGESSAIKLLKLKHSIAAPPVSSFLFYSILQLLPFTQLQMRCHSILAIVDREALVKLSK
jgi:hypothetical protein